MQEELHPGCQEQKSQGWIHMQTSLNECRICLEPTNSGQEVIDPCGCSGSVRFVHTRCLQEWIEKKLNRECNSKQAKNTLPCEICKKMIAFESSHKYRLRPCEEIHHLYAEDRQKTILILVVLFINLAIFGALLNYLIIHGFKSLGEDNSILLILILAGNVLIGLVIAVMIGFIVKHYLLKKQLRVVCIKSNKQLSEG